MRGTRYGDSVTRVPTRTPTLETMKRRAVRRSTVYIVRWMEEPRTSGPMDHPPVLQPSVAARWVYVLSDFSFSGAAAVSHRCNDRVPHLDRVPHFAKPPPTADLVWPPRAAREPKKTRSRAKCPGISPTTVRARQRARCARYMKLRRCAIVRMWRHEQTRVNCVTRASQALFQFDYRIIIRHSSAPRQPRALAESIPERS